MIFFRKCLNILTAVQVCILLISCQESNTSRESLFFIEHFENKADNENLESLDGKRDLEKVLFPLRDWSDVKIGREFYSNIVAIEEPLENYEVLKFLRETKVTLEFVDTPLTEVITFLKKEFALDIIVEPDIYGDREETEITLSVKEIDLKSLLNILAMFNGQKMRVENGFILFTALE